MLTRNRSIEESDHFGHSRQLTRKQQHLRGEGARLTRSLRERGIGFAIAHVWPSDRAFERKLKRRKAGPRLCPIWGRARLAGQLPPDPLGELPS